ncbi:hypothetical protein M5K25_017731 [Dendrobium thyrsiflorum]|uniref:Uncharacterized protein n=1 Tax=Dendrobium thyrsiflorum TaxID=117978 RepID=A0ABD0UVQ4_DENTH
MAFSSLSRKAYSPAPNACANSSFNLAEDELLRSEMEMRRKDGGSATFLEKSGRVGRHLLMLRLKFPSTKRLSTVQQLRAVNGFHGLRGAGIDRSLQLHADGIKGIVREQPNDVPVDYITNKVVKITCVELLKPRVLINEESLSRKMDQSKFTTDMKFISSTQTDKEESVTFIRDTIVFTWEPLKRGKTTGPGPLITNEALPWGKVLVLCSKYTSYRVHYMEEIRRLGIDMSIWSARL